MANVPALFKEEPAKLILNRRAIAAGLAALVGAPATAAAATLNQLSNVPLSFDPSEFVGVMHDGLFLPDYRDPMARIVYDDGGTTRWMRWQLPNGMVRRDNGSYSGGAHKTTRDTRAIAIECCAPDKNGAPRYTQLAIG